MILTCPKCSTRYFADATSLGSGGRTVRCASCGHTWHAKPEAVEPPVQEAEAEPEALGELDEIEPSPKPAPHQSVRAKAAQRRARRRTAAMAAAYSCVGALVLVAFGIAYSFRVEVVRAFPRAANAYALVGVAANARGLDFQDTIGEQVMVAGQPVLQISSTVVNITSKPRAVPLVRVGLLDEGAEELFAWTVALDVDALGPRESTRFTAQLERPPSGAADVELRFVDAPEFEPGAGGGSDAADGAEHGADTHAGGEPDAHR